MKLPEWKLEEPLYLSTGDNRYKDFYTQLRQQGFSDSELWNLDWSIVAFTYPRLKRFRETLIGIPSCFENNPKEWEAALDKMLDWMEKFLEKENDMEHPGKELFFKHLHNLWN